MPYLEDFNAEVPGTMMGSQFIQLKSRGEAIKFRIAGRPYFNGRHWVNNKDPVACLKVNGIGECEYCKMFEEGKVPEGPKGVDPKKVRNWYKPSISFFYPIVNRDTHQAQIFQTVLQVHADIKENAAAGIDVFKSDWKVTRVEGSPANYYSTVRLDSIALTEEEKEAYTKAKEIDLEHIFEKGAKASSLEPEVEPPLTDEDAEKSAIPEGENPPF